MKKFLTIIIILVGLLTGVLLGELAANVSWLKFLSIGTEIGFTNPVVLNLGIIQLTLGFWAKLNIAGILGLIISGIIVKKVL